MTRGARGAVLACLLAAAVFTRLLAASGAVSEAAQATTPSQAPKAARTKPAPSFDRLAKQAADARAAGRLADAVGYYRKALGLRPSWIEGHWAVATVLYELDRCGEAREHFRTVVAAQPKDGMAWAMTGLCDARLKDYDTAVADLQQAHLRGIANPEVRSIATFHMASLVNRAGNPEAAFEMLRELAAQGKDDPPIISAFGLSMLRLRFLPDEIPAEKREMVQLAGRGGYHMARGRRTAVGRLALEELVSRFPSEPNVHYALGAYIAPEDPAAAIEEFRKELRADPDHYPSLVQIAALELRQGHTEQSLPLAERAVRIGPDKPGGRLVLGRALLAAGDGERAVQELEKAASMVPESPEVHFALARAYQRLGRAEDAARARAEFLRLDQASRERQSGSEPEPGDERRNPGDGSNEREGSR